MAKFTVTMTNVVSTAIEVEAEDSESAINAAYESDQMPGSMTIGAFGGNNDVDEGDWNVEFVYDEHGTKVWTESPV